MPLVLKEAFTSEQQMALAQAVFDAAVSRGIIAPESEIRSGEFLLHLLGTLGEGGELRKKIVEFKDGVIHSGGRTAWLTLSETHPDDTIKGREVQTSLPITPRVAGKDDLTYFETANTMYIMAPSGDPVRDYRPIPE